MDDEKLFDVAKGTPEYIEVAKHFKATGMVGLNTFVGTST
jgi:hypothetical protein